MMEEGGREERSVKEKREAGVCCRRAVRKLKAEFETRLTALEGKMSNDRQKDKVYADNLKKFISHREKQIVAMREQLKAKVDIIDELRQRILTRVTTVLHFLHFGPP